MGFVGALTCYQPADRGISIDSTSDGIFLPLALQQFAEFLHLASAAVIEKASAVCVPFVIMNPTNPVSVGIAIDPDVNGSRFLASEIAAVEIFHDLWFLEHIGFPQAEPLS